MKIVLSILLLVGLSMGVYGKPIIIGKNQAPINQHDYGILKKVAINAGIPVEKFKHYQRNHYIVGPEGFLYWDKKKNGVIDGVDQPEFITISRAKNSYMTDKEGFITALKIKETKFKDTDILNKFKKIVSINLTDNSVNDINISNLSDLRFLRIFEDDKLRIITQLSNVNKLAYLDVDGLNTPNFKKFTGVKGLYKVDISGMGIESFAGLENMPNLKELEVSANGKGTAKNFTSLAGIPKGHKLEKLKLSSSVTTDVKGIANFTHLKRLELWANKRALTDYTPLNKLKNLEELELSVLGLTDLSFIDDMPELKKITTFHSPITSLAGVSNAPNLEYLELQRGKVAKIEHLDMNSRLKTLILNGHQLTKIEGLTSLKKLSTLDLSLNKIKKIEGLDNNLCLEKLMIGGNPIKTLDNVYHLPILSELGLNRTKISEFPKWQQLKRLHTMPIGKKQLNPDVVHKNNFWWVNVPIKDFDLHMRNQPEISDKERIQVGCI